MGAFFCLSRQTREFGIGSHLDTLGNDDGLGVSLAAEEKTK